MYICSARNIYIYLCPQIYGIAHTPCYQFVLHNFVTTKRKLGKYLIFIRPLGRVGGNLGGQARGRSLSAPLAAPTLYRMGSGGVKLQGKHPPAQPPRQKHANAQCTWSMDARIELGEYLNMFRRYATPEIEIRALRTRLHFASFSPRRQRRREVTPCPEAWVNTGRGWGASRKIKRQLFWVK